SRPPLVGCISGSTSKSPPSRPSRCRPVFSFYCARPGVSTGGSVLSGMLGLRLAAAFGASLFSVLLQRFKNLTSQHRKIVSAVPAVLICHLVAYNAGLSEL